MMCLPSRCSNLLICTCLRRATKLLAIPFTERARSAQDEIEDVVDVGTIEMILKTVKALPREIARTITNR